MAVVDTGIAPRHPDLRVYGGASFVPGVTRWHDDHYHGTHVAGTIAAAMNRRGVVGVAPAARLYAVKVLDRRGRGQTSWILNGLAWCYRYRMHVVNLSLGSGATTHSTSNYSRAYENAGRLLRRRGILPVAAVRVIRGLLHGLTWGIQAAVLRLWPYPQLTATVDALHSRATARRSRFAHLEPAYFQPIRQTATGGCPELVWPPRMLPALRRWSRDAIPRGPVITSAYTSGELCWISAGRDVTGSSGTVRFAHIMQFDRWDS